MGRPNKAYEKETTILQKQDYGNNQYRRYIQKN